MDKPQKCGEIPNFRCRLGGKNLLSLNNQSGGTAENTKRFLRYKTVTDSERLSGGEDTFAVRLEFLLNFWRARLVIKICLSLQGKGTFLNQPK